MFKNAYLRKNTFENLYKLELFNREALSACFVYEQKLNNYIEELDSNGLNSLKKINFDKNQITKIHPSTFNGLTNLEKISFYQNKIEELDPTTFNGLNSLKKINFSQIN